MYEDYDWFMAILNERGGTMSTDYATINYITIEELDNLENRGIIERVVTHSADFIFTTKHLIENYAE